MTHVFISFSQEDADHARNYAAELERRGFTVWMDGSEDRSFGENSRAIRECAACVVINSARAAQSEWVEMEMLVAKKYNKRIFPLEAGNLPDEAFFAELERVAPVNVHPARFAIEAQIIQLLAREIREFGNSPKMFGPSWAIGIVRVWTQHIPGKGRQIIAYVLRDDVLNQELPEMEGTGWESFNKQVVKQWALTDNPGLPAEIADDLIAANELLGIACEEIKIEGR